MWVLVTDLRQTHKQTHRKSERNKCLFFSCRGLSLLFDSLRYAIFFPVCCVCVCVCVASNGANYRVTITPVSFYGIFLFSFLFMLV
ncbi:hypothetical protein TCDM_05245 [Trypanosoma cruzi Dm28c]|uniref:Uncharacterized protein n=1 Tax=Trypanosoma cruzi Dm28c TaxID=1416333 RepID=V5BEG9_TRYCR|nr:hypothetical protein TCDM_05245 [Trypanosoma cruzi Dm28c]